MKKALLLLLILPIGIIHAFDLTSSSNYRNFTLRDGLADNMIFCIHKDYKGFMWFGTNYGLSKYDGKNFYNFPVRGNFNTSVLKIQENSEGLLFLLSNDWLTLFDTKKELVQNLNVQDEGINCQFVDFALINDSVLLACSVTSFFKINVSQRKNNALAEIIGKCSFTLRKGEMLMKFVILPNQRDIYAFTNYGRVFMIDQNTMHVKKTAQLPSGDKSIGISSISYYDGNLWIATVSGGIFICDLAMQHINHFVNHETQTVLSHNDVYSLCHLSDNQCMAVTWFGYTILQRDKGKQDSWNTKIFQDMSCNSNWNIETRLISSYYDPVGIVWIGTHGGGIIMVDLRWHFYKRYEQGCDNETECFVTDNNGRIYISTYHLGIMRSVKPFQSTEQNLDFEKISIPEVSATFLCSVKDEKDNLWFGNKDGRIVCYNPLTESYKIYDILSELNVSVNSLHIDTKHRFWVGTSKGLFLINKELTSKIPIILENQYPNVLDIKEDKEHKLWIATGVGVFRLEEEKNMVKVLRCDQRGWAANTAQCILVASDGNVYVGFKNGLGIIHHKTIYFSKFLTTADGLIGNWINCIMEGLNKDIWIGTNSGITRYDQKYMCYNYYISGSNRSVANIGEELFWGGSKHVLYFNQKEAVLAFESNYNNKVFITNLEVNGKRVNVAEKYNGQVILQQQIAYTDEITLNYANRDLAFSFSNCSYSYGMQKYEYRLWPYQNEWIICDDGKSVSYANLSAGEYRLQIRTIYPGKLDSEINVLKITILPHWAQTWMFRIIALCCVLALIFYLLLRMKKQHRQRERLLRLEYDLNMANLLKEQEINMGKEREHFFVQAAHELRTPLTLILAPLSELLLSTSPNDNSYTKLLYIRKSAKFMESLINQLLHVQKMKAGMLRLCVSKAAIRNVVERVASSFKEFAVQHEIEFCVTINYDVEVYIDVEKIESALRNLLSNAFKYTRARGNINIIVFSKLQDDCPYCCIQVSDNGIGIPSEQQSQIFESFATGNKTPNHSNSVGIGLYIVKSIVELHHGFVGLESYDGKGSSFTLCIPEGDSHFANESCILTDSPKSADEDKDEDIIPDRVLKSSTTNKKSYGQSILIVEDNMDVRSYIVSLFNDIYRVYEASDGEEGICKAKQYLPDLVISDVMMPVKDGFEFCKELKSDNSTLHIPVIMLTARTEDADIIKATHLGIDDYLIKPFNVGVLKAKVKSILLQRQQLKDFYSKSFNLKLSESCYETSGDEAFMQQAIYIIEANLTNETFNAKTLSALLNMSQPTLYRKIKGISQLSIIEVIRSVRISKAASLLILRKYSVQEVCEMVGYNDYDTFRKHFVAQFKVSPSKYESTFKEE